MDQFCLQAYLNNNFKMKISSDLIDKHGIKPDEYKKIINLIKKEPNLLELGIF